MPGGPATTCRRSSTEGFGRHVRLILLTTRAMCAFAASSVLNRVAVADGAMDPTTCALIRLVAGAAMLTILVRLRGGIF